MKNKYILTADEFLLMESLNEKIVTAKRKYGDYPSINISTHAPVREKILSYINQMGVVTETELQMYLTKLSEESGKRPNFDWIKRNSKYVIEREIDGEKVYKLSRLGQKVIEII